MSRRRRPKQFLELVTGNALIVETWRRVRKLAAPARVWVVAPRALARDVRRALPELLPSHLILEPSPRDTAPAIGLACATVVRHSPKAIVGVFPTDHVIRNTHAFSRTVHVAVSAASRGALVCLGIRPTRPATGFGYLKCSARPSTNSAVDVTRFVEKPDAAEASRFVRSGQYLWNGGMFVWGAQRFLDELSRVAPGIHDAVTKTVRGAASAWNRCEKRSVDFAVMEKATGVRVVALDAGWDDVGSWAAAARLRSELGTNAGGEILLDSPDSHVFGAKRLVALLGVPGVIVVDTPDALLVAARDRSEDVRRVVEELRRLGLEGLL
jgi:mannose-1-phosphate guanylyltransferase/mannose-6-phosphate isomerase